MRSASSYRSARKKAAREIGIPLSKYNRAFQIAVGQEEAKKHPPPASQAMLEQLAVWARNGGRLTAASPAASQSDLDRMNAGKLEPLGPKEQDVPAEKAVEQAKKITPEDVDKAMEAALTRWQGSGREDPMPLSKLFAARARELGWVEQVEFVEED